MSSPSSNSTSVCWCVNFGHGSIIYHNQKKTPHLLTFDNVRLPALGIDAVREPLQIAPAAARRVVDVGQGDFANLLHQLGQTFLPCCGKQRKIVIFIIVIVIISSKALRVCSCCCCCCRLEAATPARSGHAGVAFTLARRFQRLDGAV